MTTHIKPLKGEELAQLRQLMAAVTETINAHTQDPDIARNALFIVASGITLKGGKERDDYKIVRIFRETLEELRRQFKNEQQTKAGGQ